MSAGPQDISRAVIRLAAGGLVAFPTETVYGLGADASNPEAIARVYALKGRPSTNPLIVHVTGSAMARRLVTEWTHDAQKLADAFWPGPLTLALPRAPGVHDLVTAGGGTVAIRAPDHPVTLSLIERFGSPLVGPSANPSGRVSPTTAQHVRDAFSEEEVLVLDGGASRAGIESTVVDLSETTPRVLRPGFVSAEQIARVLGKPVERGHASETPSKMGAPARSPGLLPQHYAPIAPAMLFDAPRWGEVARESNRIVALAISSIDVAPPHALLPMPTDARQYAARLYAALREADAMNPTLIAIERPPLAASGGHADSELWDAIMDRLSRAASNPM
jgi:L-threonylcarbamoyladenylate synthase